MTLLSNSLLLNKKTLFLLVVTGIILPLHYTLAVNYQTMVNIPGVTDVESLTFGSYVNVLYNLAIVGAALLAVVQLVLAGAMYMASDANVASKGAAIAKIQGALVGLLIIIAAWVILREINDQLLLVEPFTDVVPTNVTGARMDDYFNDIRDFIDDIQVASSPTGSACRNEDMECMVTVCPFWRYQMTCQSWCEDRGGVTDGTLVGNAAEGIVFGEDIETINCYHPVDPLQQDLLSDTITLIEVDDDEGVLPDGTTIDPVTDRATSCSESSIVVFGSRCSTLSDMCESGGLLPGATEGTPEIVSIREGTPEESSVLICRG